MIKKKITIKDIALAAGVSNSTVSIVLGRRGDNLVISQETQERVRDIADKLGYHRNELAYQIKSGKTKAISFFVYGHAEHLLRIFSGLVNKAQQFGYCCKLHETGTVPGEKCKRLYSEILAMRPEAVVIHPTIPEREYLLKLAEAMGILVGCADRTVQEYFPLTVYSNSFHGEYEACKYLYQCGHRRIGFLGDFSMEYTNERYRGFIQAVTDYQIECLKNWIVSGSEAITELMMEIKNNPQTMPTAFCCSSDYLALALIMKACNFGIKIPDQLSVVGYGGLDFIHYAFPEITSIEQDFEKIGKTMAAGIINRLKNTKIPDESIAVNCKIIAGESVKDIRQNI